MPTDKARIRLHILSVVALVSATGIAVCDESSPPESLHQKEKARRPDRAVLSLDVFP